MYSNAKCYVNFGITTGKNHDHDVCNSPLPGCLKSGPCPPWQPAQTHPYHPLAFCLLLPLYKGMHH